MALPSPRAWLNTRLHRRFHRGQRGFGRQGWRPHRARHEAGGNQARRSSVASVMRLRRQWRQDPLNGSLLPDWLSGMCRGGSEPHIERRRWASRELGKTLKPVGQTKGFPIETGAGEVAPQAFPAVAGTRADDGILLGADLIPSTPGLPPARGTAPQGGRSPPARLTLLRPHWPCGSIQPAGKGMPKLLRRFPRAPTAQSSTPAMDPSSAEDRVTRSRRPRFTSGSSVRGSIIAAERRVRRACRAGSASRLDDQAGRHALLEIVALQRPQPGGELHQGLHALFRQAALRRDDREFLLRRGKGNRVTRSAAASRASAP